jgi:hypothetical protein
MKILIIILLLSTSIITYSQPADSLRKYSYTIFGCNLKTMPFPFTASGTAFFIKRNNSIFLITAKHLLTGCEKGVKTKEMPDFMSVYLPEKDTLLNIDIRLIKDTVTCFEKVEDGLDVIVIKLDNFWKSYISNTVEKFINPLFKKVKSIEIFGFPFDKNHGFRMPGYDGPVHITIPEKEYEVIQAFDSTGKVDTLNYRVFADSAISDSIKKGFSGSPVFIQDTDSKKWRVMGVLVASGLELDTRKRLTYIPHMEYVISLIDKYH